MEIESPSDISAHFRAGIEFLHEGDLPSEVFALGVGGNPAIADDDCTGGFSNVRVGVVAPLTRCCPDCLDSAFVGILPQCIGMQSQEFRRLAARYVRYGPYVLIIQR